MKSELFRGKQLRLRVLRRHFNKATHNGARTLFDAFTDNKNCPIACAVKEKFPGLYVSVAPTGITIGKTRYGLVGGMSADIFLNKPMTVTLTK